LVNARTAIALDSAKLNSALARFPRDRAMWIGGREALGSGETIERQSPAHGVAVTRVPRGVASDARLAIAAARNAFDSGRWPHETASHRARVLLKTADLLDRDSDLLAPSTRSNRASQSPRRAARSKAPPTFGGTRLRWRANCRERATPIWAPTGLGSFCVSRSESSRSSPRGISRC
jgi:hypothetical protein